MARGRKKGRESRSTPTIRQVSEESNTDSGAPHVKESRLDSPCDPLSPSNRSLKERITDYFAISPLKLDHNYVITPQQDRASSASPTMPQLLPQVVPRTPSPASDRTTPSMEDHDPPPHLLPLNHAPPNLLPLDLGPSCLDDHAPPIHEDHQTPPRSPHVNHDLSEDHAPPQLPHGDNAPRLEEDHASDRSEGDSGKENEAEDIIGWRGSRSSINSRGSRPRSGHLTTSNTGAVPKQTSKLFRERSQENGPLVDGKAVRVTRSNATKQPLTLNTADRLDNQDKINVADNNQDKIPRSPPTPHKIIKTNSNKMMSPANALQKLKISFTRTTPKKKSSTKGGKSTKRLGSSPDPKPPHANTKAGKMAAAAENSRKIPEYFQTRRSVRKPKSELLQEEKEKIEARLTASDDSGLGLEVQSFPDKGRGVVATRTFKKSEFVVEYSGEIVDLSEAKERETKYSMDVNKGCYMYYFKHKGKQYCIDATGESGRLGRLVNHSCKNPNMFTTVVMLGDQPRLILKALQDIPAGTELLYDYGDRDKESLKAHPWLLL